jgi:hypothetical protein
MLIAVIMSVFLAWTSFGLVSAQALSDKFEALQLQMIAGPHGQVPPPEFERMMALQRAMLAASRPDFAAPVGVLGLVVAVAGIVCAVRLNRGRRDSVIWFSRVTIAIVTLEVVGIVQFLLVQRRFQPLMADFMAAIPVGAHSQEAEPFMNMLKSAFTGMSAIMPLFTVGWGLAKIVACLYARHAARKPAVEAWIAGQTRTLP